MLPIYSPVSPVKRLWRTKTSFRAVHAQSSTRSLIEQSSARRAEMPDESTTGMIPGDRGMVGGNWCRPPLPTAQAGREAYITSSSGRSRVRSVQTRNRNCATKRDQKPRRVESGPRDVSTCAPTQLPQRLRLLLRRPERQCATRRDDPAKRPRSPHEQGAQGKHTGGESTGLGKAREPPHGGGVKTHVTPLQSPTQPER